MIILLFSFLVTEYNQVARSLYSKSLHPKHGYPFAIAAINVISWTHSFLIDGNLKKHFYSQSVTSCASLKMKHFYKLFGKKSSQFNLTIHGLHLFNFKFLVCLFVEFNDYWFLKEPNVMQFETISKEFTQQARGWLKIDANLLIKEHQLDKLYSDVSC